MRPYSFGYKLETRLNPSTRFKLFLQAAFYGQVTIHLAREMRFVFGQQSCCVTSQTHCVKPADLNLCWCSIKTLSSLFAYKTWADTELLDLVENAALTNSFDSLRSAVRRLSHINVSDRIFRAHLSGELHGFTNTNTEETPTVSMLRIDILDNDKWFEHMINSTSTLHLQEVVQFTFTDGDKGAMSREEMLLHVITHGGYHRGNVGEMLNAIGVKAPRDLYTRFLHCVEPARRHV